MQQSRTYISWTMCNCVLLCVLLAFWSCLEQWRCQRMTWNVWWILGIYIPLYICTILRKEQPRVTMATAASSEWASFPLSSVNMMIVVCICSQYCSCCAAHRSLYRGSCKKEITTQLFWLCLRHTIEYPDTCVCFIDFAVINWCEKYPSLKSYHSQRLCT